jgi:hypothetical protein
MRATLRLLLALPDVLVALPDVLDELLVHLPQNCLQVYRLLALLEDGLLGRVVGGDVGPPTHAALADAARVLALVVAGRPDAAVARAACADLTLESAALVVEGRQPKPVDDDRVVAVVAVVVCCASVRFAAVAPRCTSVRLAGLRVHLPPSSASRETRGGR